MKRAAILCAALAAVLGVVLVLVVRHRPLGHADDSVVEPSPASTLSATAANDYAGFLYGRVTTDDATYEGRLRWGVGEEAFWGDSFNGYKRENPWRADVPPERLNVERRPFEIFGFEIARRPKEAELGRPFMARFGDITRIERMGRDVRVTLKSGNVFDLDIFDASDFDDDLRVWDATRGVVDLASRRIRVIELLPTAPIASIPSRLHGTVRTSQGDFSGFIQWDREACVGTDELDGNVGAETISVPFDTIRSIARQSPTSSSVERFDGHVIVLSGTRDVGAGNRGIYVDDRRYGRVLISWEAFERVDFSPGGSGPAYDDFPPGQRLVGSVTTRTGRRLAGRLVYDLDESETTETLDAPSQGVDYMIPFGSIESIVLPGADERDAARATVRLRDDEELRLELRGDLGEGNAGMLILVEDGQRPEHVPWTDVASVELDHPSPAPSATPGAEAR